MPCGVIMNNDESCKIPKGLLKIHLPRLLSRGRLHNTFYTLSIHLKSVDRNRTDQKILFCLLHLHLFVSESVIKTMVYLFIFIP
jgi:hypothetical protein